VNTITTLVAVAACGIMASQAHLLASSGRQQKPAAPAEATAIEQFESAIANYLALRNKLRAEVRGPVANSTAAQLTNASDALAGGIERARKGAQVGAIFGAPIAALIKRRIAEAVRGEHLASTLARIDDDGKSSTPRVHRRLPVSEQMATMPPSLLKVLPTLPEELEYRIVGTFLVIRDVDASLILDYIPDAVPR